MICLQTTMQKSHLEVNIELDHSSKLKGHTSAHIDSKRKGTFIRGLDNTSYNRHKLSIW